jgi:hypothetical protein
VRSALDDAHLFLVFSFEDIIKKGEELNYIMDATKDDIDVFCLASIRQ